MEKKPFIWSNEDLEIFFDAVFNKNLEPNEDLKKAAKEHKEFMSSRPTKEEDNSWLELLPTKIH